MDIDFTSHDPDKAARIVNALADAYIEDQLNAKYQAARRASAWLQERLSELRNQASAGERAVVDFKGQNNIVDTGGGRLINEQQLTEINSQLVLARAAAAEAKARLASPALKSCVDALRGRYDYVIIDLAPVTPVVDVRATGHFIDTYIYVIEWGKTKIEAIKQGLTEAQNVSSRLLGVVLNKVDLAAHARYEPYRGLLHQSKHYAKYGFTE